MSGICENQRGSIIVPIIKLGILGAGVAVTVFGVPVGLPAAEAINELPIDRWVERMKRRFWGANLHVDVDLPTDNPHEPSVGNTPPLAEVLEQTKQLMASEEFIVAVQEVILSLPGELGNFITTTGARAAYMASGADNADGTVGLWPAFALESIARASIQTKLGDAAVVAQSDDIRALVERGLALDATETLLDHGCAENHERTGVQLSEGAWVFHTNRDFKWSETFDLSPGYVVAYLGQCTNADLETAQRDCGTLIATLGSCSNAKLGYLSESWLRTCKAEVQSPGAGEYIDSGLCMLDFSVFNALSATPEARRENLQRFVASVFTALGANNRRAEREFRRALKAFAENDRNRFEACARGMLVACVPQVKALAPANQAFSIIRETWDHRAN